MSSLSFDMPDKIFGFESSLLKYFSLPAVLVVLVFVSFSFVLQPKIDEISKMRKDMILLKEQKSKIVEKKNYLLSIDEDELKENDKYLSNSVLRDRNSYFLVGVIRRIADKHLFMVDSFNVSPGELAKEDAAKKSQTKTGYTSIPVKINLIGPKSEYLNLLLAMEKSLPVLSIDNFDMKLKDNLAELSLTVSSYFVEARKEMTSNDLSLSDLTLNKTEQELLSRIGEFEDYASFGQVDIEGKEFVEYERGNPFSL